MNQQNAMFDINLF